MELRPIRGFLAEGGLFIHCNGSRHALYPAFSGPDPVNYPGILGNGGLVYDFQRDSVIWESSVSETVVPLLRELAGRLPVIGIETFTKNGVPVLRQNRWTRWRMGRDHQPNQVLGATEMTEDWFKLTVADSLQGLPEVIGWLSPRLGGLRTAASEPYFYSSQIRMCPRAAD